MSKPDKSNLDPVLATVCEHIEPISEEMTKKKEEYVLFCLAGKAIPDGIQTYTNVTGVYENLGEALFAEISSQIENGDTALFSLLVEVVRHVQEEYGISAEVAELTNDTDTTVH